MNAEAETFEGYSARMKRVFAADKVYAATRDSPAVVTHTRTPNPQKANDQAAERGMITGPGIAGLIDAALPEEPEVTVQGHLEDRMNRQEAGPGIHPVEYAVLDQLTALVKQAAGEPELLFVATDALGDEMERLGMSGKELTAVRESARAVKQTIGHSADVVWKQQSWWEQIRNRKRKARWKQVHTYVLLFEAQRLVDTILEDR